MSGVADGRIPAYVGLTSLDDNALDSLDYAVIVDALGSDLDIYIAESELRGSMTISGLLELCEAKVAKKN